MFLKINRKSYYIFFTVSALFISVSSSSCRVKDSDIKGKIENCQDIPIDEELAHRMDSCFKKYLRYGPTAIYLYDITADKPIYGYNKDSLMHSASCMKLLTGVAALQLLGTDYIYETKLLINGEVVDEKLNGDLTLMTGLDPQLLTSDFTVFAKELKQKGIKEIEGNIYIDAQLTTPVKAEEHWYPWDLTFNRYGILFKGGERVMRDFKASIRAQGIKYDSKKVSFGKVSENSKCIFTLQRPIGDVVKKMWENSSNTQSTALLYNIGMNYKPEGNFVDNGIEYLKEFVKEELRLKDHDAIIHDGCGLCIHNKLTPELLVRVLRYGYYKKSIYEMMQSYFPVSGKTGSLRSEMVNSKARGKIYAKTGTLSHPYGISTLAGFCKGKNDHLLCFAIMSYNMSVLDGRMIQRKMCEEFIK